MTLLGKVRLLLILILLFVGGMGVAPALAQQDQSTPNTPPDHQPGTPATAGTNAPAETTGPAVPNQEQPKATGEASSQQATRRVAKTTQKKRKKTTPTATTESGKVVVSNGGAKEHPEQLAPAMTKEQELHERANTNQLLATTDANLKSIAGRQLTPVQQNMLAQIRSYVNQSKAASDAGDLARANTFASKAHLLSDELAKK